MQAMRFQSPPVYIVHLHVYLLISCSYDTDGYLQIVTGVQLDGMFSKSTLNALRSKSDDQKKVL